MAFGTWLTRIANISSLRSMHAKWAQITCCVTSARFEGSSGAWNAFRLACLILVFPMFTGFTVCGHRFHNSLSAFSARSTTGMAGTAVSRFSQSARSALHCPRVWGHGACWQWVSLQHSSKATAPVVSGFDNQLDGPSSQCLHWAPCPGSGSYSPGGHN